MGLGWWLFGLLAYISVIGIPWGRACFVMGQFAFFPFGKEAISRKELQGTDDVGTGVFGTLGNIIWFLFAGIWLALGHVISACISFVTIIGIPFGIQHLKLAGLSLSPIGKTVVSKEIVTAAREANACLAIDGIRGSNTSADGSRHLSATDSATLPKQKTQGQPLFKMIAMGALAIIGVSFVWSWLTAPSKQPLSSSALINSQPAAPKKTHSSTASNAKQRATIEAKLAKPSQTEAATSAGHEEKSERRFQLPEPKRSPAKPAPATLSGFKMPEPSSSGGRITSAASPATNQGFQPRTIDQQYIEQSKQCSSGLKALLCQENLRLTLCRNRWSNEAKAGERICHVAQNSNEFSPQ